MTPDNAPHNPEAERAILGAIILDSTVLDDVVALGLSAEKFYGAPHAHLFEMFVAMREAGEVIDAITVPERVAALSPRGAKYGGIPYVVELPDACPAVAATEGYAKIVLAAATKREVRQIARELYEGASEALSDPEVAATRAMDALSAIDEEIGGGWVDLDTLFAEVLEEAAREEPRHPAIPTGFNELDQVLAGGMYPTDLLTLAARPGMGKTALAMGIVERAALRGIARGGGSRIAVFSAEMSGQQLALRVLSGRAKVRGDTMRRGRLPLDLLDKLRMHREVMQKAAKRIHVDATPHLTAGDINARTRRLIHKHGEVHLVVVDYLQLLHDDDARTREQEVAAITRKLKGMAKSLKLPVLALAQLNRAVEGKRDKRPGLADLRESGSIEQDSDVVMLIYREHYYEQTPENEGKAEVIVAKNRNGATDSAFLAFEGQYTRFDDLSSGGRR